MDNWVVVVLANRVALIDITPRLPHVPLHFIGGRWLNFPRLLFHMFTTTRIGRH